MTTAEAIASLHRAMASSNVEVRELFRAIVACTERRAYLEDDTRDIVAWVSLKCDVSHWKARRYLGCAHALEHLPVIEQAFVEGAISTDKVVELTRFATPDDEPELLAWALHRSTKAVRDRADQVLRIRDEDVVAAEKERSLEWWWDEDRTRLHLEGTLPALEGTRVTTALDRLADKMKTGDGNGRDAATTIEARRADALAQLASQTIAADGDPDRATVMVHVNLDDALDKDGNAVLDSGRPIPPPLLERMMCDSRIQPVLHGRAGVTGIGFTSRAIPRWLRRQVAHRDGHRCTYPGCGGKAFLQPHHIVPWPLGPTEMN
ncbi:MAG: hypothetical protein ACRDLB_14890, partial [Actinomycetota bacterium]